MTNENGRPARSGLFYGPGLLGYYRYRVRETYLRDHVAPMLRSNRRGAVKLDLVLRGMARLREQVVHLERRGLVERYRHRYRGHDVRVLSDRGDRTPFDDPTGRREKEDTYVTINGTLFASGTIRRWSAAEIAFYFAAMMGEAHNTTVPEIAQRGDGEWCGATSGSQTETGRGATRTR